MGEPCIVEVDAAYCEHRRQHWVGYLHEGREARDADGGAGDVVIGMGTGDHPEDESVVIGSCDGEKGGNWRSAGGGLLRIPCDGRVGVLEGGKCGEEDLSLRFLKVRVGGGVCISEEQGVPRNIGGVACH